jgi:hypothetical protein
MRGMHSKESAQKIIEAIRINYNYCREHSALDGKTPAEAAGIKLDLEGNKIENLIRLAAKEKRSNSDDYHPANELRQVTRTQFISLYPYR